GVGLGAKPGVQRRAGDVEARLGQRIADIVGRLHQPHHPLTTEATDLHRAPHPNPPGLGEALLDQDLAPAGTQATAVDDREAAAGCAAHDLGHRVLAAAPGEAEVDV